MTKVTSAAGRAFIQKWEGCRLDAYKDVAGVWTIGYGHTSMAGPPKVVPGLRITMAEADAILARDLGRYEAGVSNAVTRVPSQHQFDAMVSLCYNIGEGAFARSSVVRHFNAGDMDKAAASFALFRKSGGKVVQGLVNRRAAEAALFRKPATAPSKPAEAVPDVSAPSQPATPETPPAARETATAGFSLWGWLKRLFAASA